MKRWVSAGMAALVMASGGVGLLACGDTIVNTTNVYADGGGAADGETEAPVGEGDAGAGASDDAGRDAIACVGTSADVSSQCSAAGSCTACGGSEVYICANDDGGTRPDIAGCESVPNGDDVDPRLSSWCCPPACVRNTTFDSSCDDGMTAILCPLDQMKRPVGALPSDACVNKFYGDEQGLWCCP